MSETTYWIIVVAALAGALAIWLLTRSEPAKPAKKVRKPVEQADAAPDAISEASAAPEPVVSTAVDEAPAAKPRGRPKGAAKPQTRGRAKPAADGPPDTLTTLKGLGPKAAARLNELGVTRFAQIAAWSDEDVARIAPELGNFRDRVVRDRWVEQAGHLASGDTAGFEAKFGKLG